MKKLHAFTLIELLVVISIIAILAGLAFKAFGPAVEKARATSDLNNLKSIGTGIQMYLNDTEEAMFSVSDKDAWPTVLQKKYVPDWNSFHSPFDKLPASRNSFSGTGPAPVSYAQSKKVMDTLRTRWDNSPSIIFMAAANVNTGIAGKTVHFNAVTSADGPTKAVINSPPTVPDCGTHQARKSINILYADGHADQMDWGKFIDSSTDLGKQHWDPMTAN